MAKDIIITPASGLVDFQGTVGVSSAVIELDNNGNLNINSTSGDVNLGNTSSDVYVGDGVANVDIIFEQDGEIRGLTGKTVTLGQTDSYIKINAGLKDTNNQVGTASSVLLSTGSGVKWEAIATISGVGIQSAGTVIGSGITVLNFIGTGNTFAVSGNVVDISISGGAGAGGTWATYTAGIATNKSVGINTSTLDDSDLTGIGNSFQGLYISNGMIIVDNELSGDHYIGTNFNGLMAGPVTVTGTLTVDGNYVVL